MASAHGAAVGGLIPAHAGKTIKTGDRRAWAGAHPRSRGENLGDVVDVRVTHGSSPLTRGKRRQRKLTGVKGRLIPAHAGKTTSLFDSLVLLTAHPRSRGENRRGRGEGLEVAGSSPLTRGKQVELQWPTVGGRLIPAHAGKTSRPRSAGQRRGAHPRSRGENDRAVTPSMRRLGSSPLTRGKRRIRAAPTHTRRLIPAHAGKTHHRGASGRARQAHPRSRGENRSRPLSTCTGIGSSPLTRGKRGVAGGEESDLRLIPAHAGKTRPTPLGRGNHPAHPRSRGENPRTVRLLAHRRGSSPLTRGKLIRMARIWGPCRLIPAHAGKTTYAKRQLAQVEAHPRSRGENLCHAVSRSMSRGSSPLTRGKRFPTCAFTAQIDQILETLELAVSSGSYSVWVACATDAPQDQVRSIGLVLPSSRGAS